VGPPQTTSATTSAGGSACLPGPACCFSSRYLPAVPPGTCWEATIGYRAAYLGPSACLPAGSHHHLPACLPPPAHLHRACHHSWGLCRLPPPLLPFQRYRRTGYLQGLPGRHLPPSAEERENLGGGGLLDLRRDTSPAGAYLLRYLRAPNTSALLLHWARACLPPAPTWDWEDAACSLCLPATPPPSTCRHPHQLPA